jgi:hypothetical protein
MSVAGSQPSKQLTDVCAKGRSPMAYLLHALNQPLTGLQCSLELSLAGSRTSEQYVSAMRTGLELTARMRILVEAMGELADGESEIANEKEIVCLRALFKQTTLELQPIAEVKDASINFYGEAAMPVWAEPKRLAALIFRSLEAPLSLAACGSAVRIKAVSEQGQARISVAWLESGESSDHSALSAPALGLLIAQAGWERAGAQWASERAGNTQTVEIRLPLVSKPSELPYHNPRASQFGDQI